jgi:hypothetical protein
MNVEFAAGFFGTAIFGVVKDAGESTVGIVWFLMW